MLHSKWYYINVDKELNVWQVDVYENLTPKFEKTGTPGDFVAKLQKVIIFANKEEDFYDI